MYQIKPFRTSKKWAMVYKNVYKTNFADLRVLLKNVHLIFLNKLNKNFNFF